MDKKYICYCGLYCENCATKARVVPASRTLYQELINAGFKDVLPFMPDGEAFWNFLKGMALEGTCESCRGGSGNPGCQVRICAKEKGIEICALCDSYPCERFRELFTGYPMLKEDNRLLREEGQEAWTKLQNERKAMGYVYSEEK